MWYLAAVYALLTLCSVVACAVPQLRFVAEHGKRTSSSSSSSSSSTPSSSSSSLSSLSFFISCFFGWTVPKAWFAHFYSLGCVWTALCIAVALAYGGGACCLPLLLLIAHLARRVLECACITEFGDSTMHISGYLVGLVHYFLAPLCFMDVQRAPAPSTARTLFAVLLFAAGNVLQHQAHRHLFELKMKARALPPAQKYSLPTKGLFRWVSCPHYFAEILIYASLWLGSAWPNWAAVGLVVWVASNLTVVAHQQTKWYKDTFAHTPKDWKMLVPLVY